MNLSQLKYIVEIEKTGSISRAAANLYMNQPHLSKSVRDLEDSLGVTLFYRSSRGVIPTEQGNRILEHAKKILGHVNEIENICSGSAVSKLRLTLAAPESEYIAASLAVLAAETDPAIPFSAEYQTADNVGIVEAVEQRRCALGIIRLPKGEQKSFPPAIKNGTVKHEALWDLEYMALLSKDSPLAKGESLSPEELSGCTEILKEAENRREFGGEMEFSNNRITAGERSVRLEILHRMSRAYMLASPMSRRALERESLVQLKLEGNEEKYTDYLIYREDYIQTDTDKRFVEILKSTIKSIKEE